MRRACVIVLTCCLAAACASTDDARPSEPVAAPSPAPAVASPSASTPAQAAQPSLAEILASILPPDGTTLVIDRVRLTGSPLVGSLGGYLDERLADAAAALPGVTLVSDDARDRAIALLAESLSDLYDEASAPEVGRLLAARTLLRGTFVELSDGVRLSLEAVDVATVVARRATLTIPRGEIPSGLSSRPTNAERLEGTLAAWRAEVPSAPFVVEAWADRGNGGRYAHGETVHLFVRSALSGTLRVEVLDALGEVTPLPLDGPDGEAVLRARGVREIPDESDGFDLLVSSGEGAEVFRAVVTAADGTRAQAVGSYVVVP